MLVRMQRRQVSESRPAASATPARQGESPRRLVREGADRDRASELLRRGAQSPSERAAYFCRPPPPDLPEFPFAESPPPLAPPPLLSRDGSVRAQTEDRAIYLETFMPYHMMGWRALRGLVLGEHKFIQGRSPEIYDLARDPGESRNLAGEDSVFAGT